MTITSPVAKITADGITAPAYDEVLEYYKEKARGIFGSDINLDADTEDGQAIAILAASMNDVNSAIIAAYNAYNPTTAIGAALDGAVKTNGISRHEATHSQVDLKIVGQYGTVIRNGVAIDSSGNKWDLPETVSIPRSGEATATATAEDEGAVAAPAGSVTKIGTPTRGWQSVTNPAAATVGSAVESDAELRVRQALSTMQPTI
ncbi:MAG: baseplate J/gp47 family protein, partial [Sutterellaceae bacterium]|nr:baseplate J/gp47 family protein [Sutterellaceae bacterium]